MANKAEEFKKELKELLTKYNASIEFDCSPSSDTHGLHGEKIIVGIDRTETTLADGWSVDKSDL